MVSETAPSLKTRMVGIERISNLPAILTVVVNVDLADFDCLAEFGCEFFEDRRNRFTRAAPWSPEVDDDGDGCTYCSFKVAAIEFGDVFRHKILILNLV